MELKDLLTEHSLRKKDDDHMDAEYDNIFDVDMINGYAAMAAELGKAFKDAGFDEVRIEL